MLTLGCISVNVSMRSSFQPVPVPRNVSQISLMDSMAGSPASSEAGAAAGGAQAARMAPAAVRLLKGQELAACEVSFHVRFPPWYWTRLDPNKRTARRNGG